MVPVPVGSGDSSPGRLKRVKVRLTMIIVSIGPRYMASAVASGNAKCRFWYHRNQVTSGDSTV